jgi:hypothetical protein
LKCEISEKINNTLKNKIRPLGVAKRIKDSDSLGSGLIPGGVAKK